MPSGYKWKTKKKIKRIIKNLIPEFTAIMEFVFFMLPKRSKYTCFSYQNGSTFTNISKSKNLNSEPKNIGSLLNH